MILNVATFVFNVCDVVAMLKIYYALLFTLPTSFLFAQADSVKYASVADFLQHGKVGGSTRAYFMFTDNQTGLTDYNGLGVGAGIAYYTPTIKGFSAGMSGYFISNILSSDFTQVDETTQNPNRYELGLFDVTDPTNKYELTRLEELWIQYKVKKTSLKLGKYVPENLFINGQDGRMRPTMVQGILFKTEHKANQVELQWISRMSPRSTVKWYSVQETFGIYPTGRNPDGSPSEYFQNTETSGILIAQVTNKTVRNTKILAGSIIVPNVLQTYYLNPEFANSSFFGGLLVVGQSPLGNGGNDEISKQFATQTDESVVISGQIGKKLDKHRVDLNFTTIRSSGRFLMPREWGREPFYTFMPRERSEGMGSVNAISTNVQLVLKPQFTTRLSYGKFFVPDVSNTDQNKYGLPSYNQFNLLLTYAPKNLLKGLIVRGLYVNKSLMDNNLQNPKFIFNKVNLSLYNFILDFTF